MPVGIDLSSHNVISPQQWDILGGVLDVVTVRLSYGVTEDSKALSHVDNARHRDLKVNGYTWSDPTWDIQRQIDRIKKVCDVYQPLSLYADYEQYWTDWAAYMRQDLAECYRTRFTPSQLEKFYSEYWNALTKAGLGIPLGIYSADWFISKYAPGLSWVKKYNYLEARYFRYYDALWWANFKSRNGIPFNVANMKEAVNHATIYQGVGRQFESYVPCYGFWNGTQVNLPYNLDWDVWADMSMFGDAAIEKPEPDPLPIEPKHYIVMPSVGVNVRMYPSAGSAKVGGLPKGYPVTVFEIVTNSIGGKWAKLGENKYVLLSLLSIGGTAYKVTAAFLWVRETPGGKIVGWKKAGDLVEIMNTANGWGLIYGGGWLSINYLEKV